MSSKQIRRSCWAIALAGLLSIVPAARADIIKKEDMLHGNTIGQAECQAIQEIVWVSVDGRDFCVRYYLSTAGGEGRVPVVFLQGDYLGKLDLKNMTWIDPSETKDIDTENLVRMADDFSKMAKTTAIYLARIGVEGTSGNHKSRKTLLELHLMNAALDAIKLRHHFQGFHLVGQSGGSKLVGGLIGLRRDVVCAVSGSGPLSLASASTNTGHGYQSLLRAIFGAKTSDVHRALSASPPGVRGTVLAVLGEFLDLLGPDRANAPFGMTSPTTSAARPDLDRTYFDVTQDIHELARNSVLRILLVTDPADMNVPLPQQAGFVDKMRLAGRSIPQFMVEAIDKEHHGVVPYAQLAVAGCVLGKSDADIASALSTMTMRSAEYTARRQQEALMKSNITVGAQQDIAAAGH